MTDTPEDDLAELLGPQPGTPPAALREELLRNTQRHLLRVRWLRRAAKATAIAGVFAVGGAVGWFARPERERIVEVAGEPYTVFVPVPVLVSESPVAIPPEPNSPLAASEAELRAEQTDDRTEAAQLYRTAGDSFLRDQDYANATRCYRLFLNRAGDEGLSLSAGDSWLLTSLKNAAFKEKADVPKAHD